MVHKEIKSIRLSMVASPEEIEKIDSFSRRRGLSRSAFLRSAALTFIERQS